jgi:hypothetical protein
MKTTYKTYQTKQQPKGGKPYGCAGYVEFSNLTIG